MVSRMNGSVSSVQSGGKVEMAALDKEVAVAAVQAIAANAGQIQETEYILPAEQAKKMTESMNKFLETANTQLRFKFHEQLKEYYVTIVNPVTDEVVREIPSKKLMDIHAAMKEFVGLLVDVKI